MKFFLILFISAIPFAHSFGQPTSLGQIINEARIHYAFLKPALSIKIKNDLTSFASADSDGSTARVTLSSGLLSSAGLTPDGLRLILCHELGHIYGGSPRRHVPYEWDGPTAHDGLSFTSSEGQADYYATLSCFSKLINGQDHALVLKNNPVSPAIIKSCVHLNSEDQMICQRALLASLNFLNLNINLNISMETPDKFVAPILIQDQYPSAQCRLDTLRAGARCPKKMELVFDFVHSISNECEDLAYARPLCWYQSNVQN